MTKKEELSELGYTIIPEVFDDIEIKSIISAINDTNSLNESFRKSRDLFAIRRFLKKIPQASSLIFNDKLLSIINSLLGPDYFVVKSIYFDKPEKSNWFVSYHQDLSISVDRKSDIDNYGPWTVKQNQFAVQPPTEILTSIYTIRIHLDDTDENNGALNVIPGSHKKGIVRPEKIDWTAEKENVCKVPKGGIMLMRPLLFHSSKRNNDNSKRRVIHIEFSNKSLPTAINWSEFLDF